jgi:polar amino acid transport system substrate-binding protein
MHMRSFLLAFLFLMAGCTTAPQQGQALPSSSAPAGERLVVGTTANYPPLVYRDGDRIVGIEADFAAALASELDRQLEMVDMPWEQLPGALASGRVDVVMAGVSVTEQRRQLAAFTEPYMEIGQMTLIRSADLGSLGAADDMQRAGRIIGVEKDTTGQRLVERAYPQATLRTYASAQDGAAALRRGEIDYFVHDAPTIWLLTLNSLDAGREDFLALYQPLTREYLAWAVGKDNTALRDTLNGILQRMQQDGRARQIINKWIGTRVIVSSPERPVEF